MTEYIQGALTIVIISRAITQPSVVTITCAIGAVLFDVYYFFKIKK